jgi:hypothetical protein
LDVTRYARGQPPKKTTWYLAVNDPDGSPRLELTKDMKRAAKRNLEMVDKLIQKEIDYDEQQFAGCIYTDDVPNQ